eukprot:TRINITY_DN8400_c0_g1_i1.p1 TRINITY_DN8400_c0_g1~~TRINITY_DN8400_c0_g1_i1.p1  ORF type:complete len:413 (+),score=96.47 TRINITY_DN8400_c0_g1_i1:142-1239(+)
MQTQTPTSQAPQFSYQQSLDAPDVAASKVEPAASEGNLPVVAVIATIKQAGSFDKLFSDVPQKAPDGRVSVYCFSYDCLRAIRTRLAGQDRTPAAGGSVESVVDEFVRDVASVQPESVVFNFECCSGCSNDRFPSGFKDDVMELTQFALARKHMLMFSDFSLKALIAEWSEPHLGRNPFVQLGAFAGSFELRFSPAGLAQCPSSQLRTVGELCEKGVAAVKAMSNTIVYSVDAARADNSDYTLQVLTVATRLGVFVLDDYKPKLVTVDGHQGAAGHVLLRYPSGGLLLTSCGHWLELTQLDTNMESVIRFASSYGAEYQQRVSTEILSAGPADRGRVTQQWAAQMVQMQSPAMYTPTPKTPSKGV